MLPVIAPNHPNLHYGRRMRLESVDNAFEQAASAAHQSSRHADCSRQGALVLVGSVRLEDDHRGPVSGHDTVVVRGSAASRSFSACYLRAGELVAIDSVQ